MATYEDECPSCRRPTVRQADTRWQDRYLARIRVDREPIGEVPGDLAREGHAHAAGQRTYVAFLGRLVQRRPGGGGVPGPLYVEHVCEASS